jgi:hypothetical protein
VFIKVCKLTASVFSIAYPSANPREVPIGPTYSSEIQATMTIIDAALAVIVAGHNLEGS